jgi:hypothetical protein
VRSCSTSENPNRPDTRSECRERRTTFSGIQNVPTGRKNEPIAGDRSVGSVTQTLIGIDHELATTLCRILAGDEGTYQTRNSAVKKLTPGW